MSQTDPTADVVAYWFEKAEAALASARAEHAAGRADFAVNRAYYAAFYAAKAAMLKAGKRFTKHSAMRAAVHRDLVKAGMLPAEWGQAFDRLVENRQRADYVDLAYVEAEQVESRIADATGFVAEMRRIAAGS